MRRWSIPFLLLHVGLLAGCYPRVDLREPLPSHVIRAPVQPASRLVVVLPGRGDDLAALGRAKITEAVQSTWPDADVVLSGLALNVYMEGRAPQRLHDEIIVPARGQRRYRETWLIGASLGGIGAVMYDRAYPRDVDGLVLLAPYLGEAPLLNEIAAAGGVAQWQPGPVPAVVDKDNFQREAWRHIQSWRETPGRTRNVWVGHGDADYLRAAIPLLAPALPDGHVHVRKGGHAWSVWTPLAGEMLRQAGPTKLD